VIRFARTCAVDGKPVGRFRWHTIAIIRGAPGKRRWFVALWPSGVIADPLASLIRWVAGVSVISELERIIRASRATRKERTELVSS
jgi:hypothetical protein